MLIGSHVSLKAPKMLLGSAQEAASYGANTFMVYTGAPQNTKRKPLDEMKIPEGRAYIEEHGFQSSGSSCALYR
jgi:deoxyribonuclease-4